MHRTVTLRQGNPLIQQAKPSHEFLIIPIPGLQNAQRTGILMWFHNATVMPFQLLRDGGHRGHLVPETVNAHFTPSHSLCGVLC